MTLSQRLHDTAQRLPDKPALRVADGDTVVAEVSYAELDRRVREGAAALRVRGLRPGRPQPQPVADAHPGEAGAGDRVGLLLPNGDRFVEALYAVWAAGCVAVPLNTALTVGEVVDVLGHADARALVTYDGARQLAEEAAADLPGLEHLLVVDDDTGLAAAAGGQAEALELPVDVGEDALALLQYTSGTAGRPKGATLRHANLVANQRQLAATRHELGEHDRVLCVLPLFHIYGLNVALAFPLAVGATVVTARRFEPAVTLSLVAAERVSVIVGAPQTYSAWAAAAHVDQLDLASVRFAVSGAAPLPAETLHAFRDRFGIDVYEGYGLTETAPVLTTTAVEGRVLPGSVGQPLPDVELRLVDDDRQPVRAGEPGEVLCRGPNVFDGYWRDATATAAAMVDGWFATGDIGYLSGRALYLVDRRSDLIIVSGFNVYPREVEDVLEAHPKVARAAVVGVPDARTGEAVQAFVQPAGDAHVTPEEVFAHARTRLARFKCPQRISVVRELPTGLGGKVLRRLLREP